VTDLTMGTPGSWAGPRVVTWLPQDLPDQVQVLMRSSGLPPAAVQGGRLVQALSIPSVWSLELSVEISEEEGNEILGSLLQDRSETPDGDG
jgi:hypothetical protein